jgi:hypothetical protein
MKPHKWAKEIKAWADGAEIEKWMLNDTWQTETRPDWYDHAVYRIKPQPKEDWVMICKKCGDELGIVYEPKEPQYLYVYTKSLTESFVSICPDLNFNKQGKIKLEDE